MPIASLVPPLLRTRNFLTFWVGQTVSVIGDQVSAVALPLVAVLVLRADAAQMGLLTGIGLLPHLLFSLPAGVWLDRVRSRRQVMLLADVIRALAAASVPIAWAFGALSLEQLFAVAFLNGALTVAFDISWATLVVSIVPRERYVQANSLVNGSRSLSFVVGPPVSGALVQLVGAPLTILVDAVSFVASAISLALVRATEAPVEADDNDLRERILVGLRFMFRDPIMRPNMFGAATLNLFNFGFQALFILYATEDLRLAPGLLGLVLGAGAVGGLVGAVVAAPVGRRIGLGPAFVLGMVLFPAPLILWPLAAGAPVGLVLAALFLAEFGSGVGVMILDINSGSITLARTPDRIRARARGAARLLNYGVRPIGAMLGGYLGAIIGVQQTMFVATIGGLLGLAWLIGSPVLGLRDLPETADTG